MTPVFKTGRSNGSRFVLCIGLVADGKVGRFN